MTIEPVIENLNGMALSSEAITNSHSQVCIIFD
jgi:hypothetical protein